MFKIRVTKFIGKLSGSNSVSCLPKCNFVIKFHECAIIKNVIF